MKGNTLVFQVLAWGQDVLDADFDVVKKYATTPHPVATTLRFAEIIARGVLNEYRINQGFQLTFVTITDFTFAATVKGTGTWTYTDGDTGATVTIHELEVNNA